MGKRKYKSVRIVLATKTSTKKQVEKHCALCKKAEFPNYYHMISW